MGVFGPSGFDAHTKTNFLNEIVNPKLQASKDVLI